MPDYAQSPQYDAETKRFTHPDGTRHDKSAGELLGVAWKFFTRPEDPSEKNGFPLLETPPADPDPLRPQLVWIGHATLLFEYQNKRVLTDPVFSERASPFSFAGPRRVVPPALAVADLPPIDLVVISHSHYDHLDLAALEELAAAQPGIKVVVPLGLAQMIREAGFTDVTELDWWDATAAAGMDITATPLRHWSSRTPFDRNVTLWAGFMIDFDDGYSFYFAGDTGYSNDFNETRARLGSPDLAAIPIGAYQPRDFMKNSHVNPEEAVQIFSDLKAGHAVGIHWGTFKLTLEPMAEPPQRLAAALDAAGIGRDRFRALTHGERWLLPKPD
ncbi:MAG: MBL fold metallo-hydrolase [Candidatus Puniceispirillales bacterium]